MNKKRKPKKPPTCAWRREIATSRGQITETCHQAATHNTWMAIAPAAMKPLCTDHATIAMLSGKAQGLEVCTEPLEGGKEPAA
jgi:hypothetical protein